VTLPLDPDACDPARLAELVKGGDAEALDRITRCYGARLLRAGRRHCRTPDEADDAVQDALLIARDRLGDFRGEGSVEGWLVRIVATACRRISRSHKNDVADDDAPDTADASASPEELAARQELLERLNAALLGLTPEERLILLLAEVEGRSGQEIASELGHSHGAVRTRLTRLRARLVRELGPTLED
jgi:RNA polymerase sigma factor (sigma-70 family)